MKLEASTVQIALRVAEQSIRAQQQTRLLLGVAYVAVLGIAGQYIYEGRKEEPLERPGSGGLPSRQQVDPQNDPVVPGDVDANPSQDAPPR